VEEKDRLFGRLAVERGYMTAQSLAEAEEVLAAIEAMGVEQGLAQVAVGKGFVTRDQAQELEGAVAFQSGDTQLVADYEVISKLGQGGMGTVYKAKRLKDGRLVALKILPPSLASDDLISRFLREAGIITRLNHANIVGCVEFGLDPKRKCYFCAMDLVDGEDLAKRLQRFGAISEEEAVSTVIQIAGALQHAFDNGLVHRDVKPENIMVTPDGKAKLLDLGLARPAAVETTRLTQSGMFVGSPYYASPEQGMGEGDVDIRSDIYSLGATFYHMVTGKTPFEGGTALAVLRKHLQETLPWPAEVNPGLSESLCRIIAKMMVKDPDYRYQTPAEVISDLAVYRSKGTPDVSEETLESSTVARQGSAPWEAPDVPELAPEEDTESWPPPTPGPEQDQAAARSPIFMTGRMHEIAREETATEEADLKIAPAPVKIEDAEEVIQRRPGPLEKWQRLAAPWKIGTVALGASAALALLWVIWPGVRPGEGGRPTRAGGGAASASRARDRAARARAEKTKRLKRLKADFQSARQYLADNPGRFRRATDRLEAVRADAEGTGIEFEVEIKREIDEVRARWKEAAKASLARASADAMGLASQGDFDGALAAVRGIPEELASEVAEEIRAEGEEISKKAWQKIQLAIAETERCLGRGDAEGARSALQDLTRLRFSEGGAELAALAEPLRAKVARADAVAKDAARGRGPTPPPKVASGRKALDQAPAELGRFKHKKAVNSIVFSPDGRTLVTSSADKTLCVWDAVANRRLHVLHSYAGEVFHAEFNPRGNRIVSASADWTGRIWDVRTGKETLTLSGHKHKVRSVAWSPKGRSVATCSDDKTARVWSAVTGREQAVLKGHTSYVVRAAFNAFGDRIVTVSDDRTARIWDVRSGREFHKLSGHAGRIYGAVFSPHGAEVLTASADKTARIWQAATGKVLVTLRGHKGAVYAASFSPDGRHVLTASEDTTAMSWDAKSGRPRLVLKEHGEPVRAAAFSPDGRLILTASDDHTACVWDATSGREIDVIRGPACAVTAAVWSPDGSRIATASADGTVIIWSARSKPAK
jgi:WD40 repeat protein/serine/threonine protein kinase